MDMFVMLRIIKIFNKFYISTNDEHDYIIEIGKILFKFAIDKSSHFRRLLKLL